MENFSFSQKILVRKIRKLFGSRKKSFRSFSQVKDILLVISDDVSLSDREIAGLAEYLGRQNKDVHITVLTRDKNYSGAYDAVRYRSFLFSLRFVFGQSEDWHRRHFDLIIGYSPDYDLVLQYFVNTLSAGMIVLPFYGDPDFADISFKTKDGSLKSLVSRTVEFLNTIKNQ